MQQRRPRPRRARRGGLAGRRATAGGGPPASSGVLRALCPLLERVGGGDAAEPRNAALETLTSGLASISRLPLGVDAAQPAPAPPPAESLVLYEFEACPFCRRVREAVVDLDLEITVKPCPKNALRHRQEVLARGGAAQFPFLVDEAAGVALYESADIVRHLYATYGPEGSEPPAWLLNGTLVTGWMPTVLRAGRGMTRYAGREGRRGAPAEAPAAPLELWNYEGNQFARLVREALTELELPFIARSAGKGSARREALQALSGRTTVPFLVDPNTGVAMGESLDIVEYLFATYAPVEEQGGERDVGGRSAPDR